MESVHLDISVEELKQLTAETHETNYQLIDVRQPDEYRQGHLAGAVLIPLKELQQRLEELPTEGKLVFYCRSGQRSRAAAVMAVTSASTKNNTVYNLLGGMLAWNGTALSGMPDLRTFTATDTPQAALLKAMELERGAEQYYEILLSRLTDTTLHAPLQQLADAEQAHARMLFAERSRLTEDAQTFEELYASLPDNLLEGGADPETLLDSYKRNIEHPCRAAVETALTIEYGAYEMYRALAREYASHALEPLFLELAQAEKHHMQIAAEAIALCND